MMNKDGTVKYWLPEYAKKFPERNPAGYLYTVFFREILPKWLKSRGIK